MIYTCAFQHPACVTGDAVCFEFFITCRSQHSTLALTSPHLISSHPSELIWTVERVKFRSARDDDPCRRRRAGGAIHSVIYNIGRPYSTARSPERPYSSPVPNLTELAFRIFQYLQNSGCGLPPSSYNCNLRQCPAR